MSKNLPNDLIIEKNKIQSKYPWIVLLDITLNPNTNDEEIIRLARYTENVYYNPDDPSNLNEYQAFPFTIDVQKNTNAGVIPTISLKVSNFSRFLTEKIEEYDGGIGSTVKITIINSKYVNENYSELEIEYTVLAAKVDEENINFSLGAPSPLRQRFPLYRYIASHCRWEFKGIECGYSGGETICNKTLSDCRERENAERFGGFPGLRSNYIRVV